MDGDPSLSGDELARAARMSAAARAGWVKSRVAVREILSRYVGLPPREIKFDYSRNGKPAVQGRLQAPGFNLSHSGSVALLAVATTNAIGVDVERVRPLADMADLLDRFFSDAERREIESSPVDVTAAFYRCWTRKEALVKAVGEGLSEPSQFSVESAEVARPRVVSVPPSYGPPSRWTLASVPAPVGYAAAFASGDAIDGFELLRFA